MKAFIKKIQLSNYKGMKFNFTFKIVNEGIFGSNDFKIYILNAKRLDDLKHECHKFHILGSYGEPYICWDSTIRSFKDANGIMFVWAKKYVNEYTKSYCKR